MLSHHYQLLSNKAAVVVTAEYNDNCALCKTRNKKDLRAMHTSKSNNNHLDLRVVNAAHYEGNIATGGEYASIQISDAYMRCNVFLEVPHS